MKKFSPWWDLFACIGIGALGGGPLVFLFVVQSVLEYQSTYPGSEACVQQGRKIKDEPWIDPSYTKIVGTAEHIEVRVRHQLWARAGWEQQKKLRQNAENFCLSFRRYSFEAPWTAGFFLVPSLLFHLSLLVVSFFRLGDFRILFHEASKGIFFFPMGVILSFLIVRAEEVIRRFAGGSPEGIWLYLVQQAKEEAFSLYLLFLVAIFLAPFSEELFFRIYWFGVQAGQRNFLAAALPSSLVFTLLHILTGPGWLFLLFLYSLFLCWLYKKTRSPLALIFFHSGWNTVAILLLYFTAYPGYK